MPSATRVFVYEYLTGGGADVPDAGTLPDLADAGRAMRDALVADFAALDDVHVTRGTRGPEPSIALGRDASPRQDETAAAFVARAAREHDFVIVVAPETAGILATLRAAVTDEQWIGCSPGAVAVASSKAETCRRLAACGIATPQGWSPGWHDRRDDMQWVVKPDDGAGCIDTRRFARATDARAERDRRRARGERVTLERWVEGESLSLSLLCHDGAADLVSVNCQDIVVDAEGVVRYRGVRIAVRDLAGDTSGACLVLARRVVAAIPGLGGFVGIDLVLHPREGPVVIEVNPRITCAYVGLSAKLQRNLAREMLEHARHGRRILA